MFVNGSHMCSKLQTDSNLLCDEHNKCKPVISDTCNICLNDMSEFIIINCGHCYHKECIGEWLLNKPTCPCCRNVVKTQNYNYENDFDPGFIDWFYYMATTYINSDDISLSGLLILIQSIPTEFDYYLRIYNNDKNNISINLFELEFKLNTISNYFRYLYMRINEINEDNNEVDIEDIDDEYYSENDMESDVQYLNINDFLFTEFQ